MLGPYRHIPGELHADRQARIARERQAITEANRKAANLRRRLEAGEGRYVFVDRPRCPECQSVNLKPYRTTTDGETISRHEACQTCGTKFILVLE